MENRNDRSWYSTSDEREWFRQYTPRLTAELPEPKKKKPRTGMKAVIRVPHAGNAGSAGRQRVFRRRRERR